MAPKDHSVSYVADEYNRLTAYRLDS